MSKLLLLVSLLLIPFTVSNAGAQETTAREHCVEWNGFLGFLAQVLELKNVGLGPLEVQVTLYDITSSARGSVVVRLLPDIQQDLIVNDLTGFEANSYGLVCVATEATTPFAGQLVSYQLTEDGYALAFTSAFQPARTGEQYLIYNTYQPSLLPEDRQNLVANWLQVVNESEESADGSLAVFDASGNQLEARTLTFQPGERKDLPLHEVGKFRTGLVRWTSASGSGFRLKQNRYYYGPAGMTDLCGAVSLGAQELLRAGGVAAFDTRNQTVALEVANAGDEPASVSVKLYDASGQEVSTQPLDIVISARGTGGLVLNDYAPNVLGSIVVTPRGSADALAAYMMSYGRTDRGGLTYAGTTPLTASPQSSLRGTYNSFLGQQCRIRVTSTGVTQQSARVSMTRFDGTRILERQRLRIPARGTVELDLCEHEDQEAYGVVELELEGAGAVAEVVRGNQRGTVEFTTSLSPALAVCSGDGKEYPEQGSSPYMLPWQVGEQYTVGQGNCTRDSHSEDQAYAYDFDMDIGTAVTAARAGIVIFVEERFVDGNREPDDINAVVIQHEDGTVGGYYHLTQNGALVSVGQLVTAGQVIGLSGDTGDSTGPHLHFEVLTCFDCDSVPVTFKNTSPHPQGLIEGETYLAH
ncbi:MAG: M23 family metallopeptidase [Bdellovibrionales bacterium]|nr:M23 family metallopeptidase [Bdellovibrionales bacterium]